MKHRGDSELFFCCALVSPIAIQAAALSQPDKRLYSAAAPPPLASAGAKIIAWQMKRRNTAGA